ncbi:MAG: hypothetical protein INR68_11245 [Methylobacterium mesophilicum]|nr:hypothetical protein [Methylobacterium mesophilicum]
MSFDLPRNRILPVREVDVRLEAGPHPFAKGREDEIRKNWEAELGRNPALFNGEMALLASLSWRDERLTGTCHIVPYSTFMLWRRIRPVASAEHCFAHAMPVGSDDALVAARMGGHTANAGRVYFAAGSFEPEDFRAGRVDPHFNMAREVGEETGLDLDRAEPDAAFHCWSGEGGTVIFRRYRFAETADVMAQGISRFVAGEEEPEIEGPVVIRSADDLPAEIMPHMRPLVEWHFEKSGVL